MMFKYFIAYILSYVDYYVDSLLAMHFISTIHSQWIVTLTESALLTD